jgi:hypothetical protein
MHPASSGSPTNSFQQSSLGGNPRQTFVGLESHRQSDQRTAVMPHGRCAYGATTVNGRGSRGCCHRFTEGWGGQALERRQPPSPKHGGGMQHYFLCAVFGCSESRRLPSSHTFHSFHTISVPSDAQGSLARPNVACRHAPPSNSLRLLLVPNRWALFLPKYPSVRRCWTSSPDLHPNILSRKNDTFFAALPSGFCASRLPEQA